MNKIRTIASRLNAFLQSNDLTNSPTLQNILADYVETCTYVNGRLAHCGALLEKDKPGEALLAAEKTPSLFSIVPLLQSPNLTAFFGICNLYRLPSPPVLKTTIYKMLEKQQGELETLPSLLAELRKLSRVPGSEEKVIVLRKISALDPENPEWRKQLKQAEAVCVPALIDAAQKAIKDEDFESLEELNEALSSPAWQLVIPEIVIEKIQKTLEAERQRQLRLRAKQILDEADNAYSRQHFADFVTAENHWKLLCEIDKYIPSEEESRHFAIAEAFFEKEQEKTAKEDEFSEYLRQMNSLIRSTEETDIESIRSLYNRLVTFDCPIPQNIIDFVEVKQNEYQTSLKQQSFHQSVTKFVYTLVLVALFVLGSVSTWYVYSRKNYLSELDKAVQATDTSKACRILSEIEKSPLPYFKFSANLRDLKEKVEQLTKDEEHFEQLIVDCERLLSSEDAAVNEENEEYLQQKLNECKIYANTLSTKQKLTELENKIKSGTRFYSILKSKHNQKGNKILEDIKKLESEFNQLLKAGKFVEANAAIEQIKPKITECEKLKYYDTSKLPTEEKDLLSLESWQKKLSNQQGAFLVKKLSTFRSNFGQLLKESKFTEAYEILNEAKSVIAEIEDLKYFDLQNLAKPEKDLVQIMAWVDRYHYEIFKFIQKLIENQQYEKALDMVSTYEQDEENWPELYTSSKSIHADLKSAKELRFYIEIYGLLQEYASLLASSNERGVLLQKIEQALEKSGLGEEQKNLFTKLKQQIVVFGKICDYQNGFIKTFGDVASNDKFFFDLAEEQAWCSKETEILVETKKAIAQFVTRQTTPEIHFFAFRDSKSKVHSWIFDKGDISFTPDGTYDDDSEGKMHHISFKIRDELITIQDDKVTVNTEADGVNSSLVYNNVKFIYPAVVSEQSLRETRIEYQEILTKALETIESIDGTIFCDAYYSLLANLKAEEQTCLLQRLELYKFMMAPFATAAEATMQNALGGNKLFNNASTLEMFKATLELGRKINDLLRSVQNDSEKLAVEDIEAKYKVEIAQLDFSVIDKLIKIVSLEHELRANLLKRQFSCIGVAITGKDGTVDFVRGAKSDLKPGEVWALTTESGSMLAGRTDGQSITWNEKTSFAISLVFCPTDSLDIIEEAAAYRNKMWSLGVKNITWPRFFPENLTK